MKNREAASILSSNKKLSSADMMLITCSRISVGDANADAAAADTKLDKGLRG